MTEVKHDFSIDFHLAAGSGDLPLYQTVARDLRNKMFHEDRIRAAHTYIFNRNSEFDVSKVRYQSMVALKDKAISELTGEPTVSSNDSWDMRSLKWIKSLQMGGARIVLPPEFAPAALLTALSLLDYYDSEDYVKDSVATALNGLEGGLDIRDAITIDVIQSESNMHEKQAARTVLEGIAKLVIARNDI